MSLYDASIDLVNALAPVVDLPPGEPCPPHVGGEVQAAYDRWRAAYTAHQDATGPAPARHLELVKP